MRLLHRFSSWFDLFYQIAALCTLLSIKSPFKDKSGSLQFDTWLISICSGWALFHEVLRFCCGRRGGGCSPRGRFRCSRAVKPDENRAIPVASEFTVQKCIFGLTFPKAGQPCWPTNTLSLLIKTKLRITTRTKKSYSPLTFAQRQKNPHHKSKTQHKLTCSSVMVHSFLIFS